MPVRGAALLMALAACGGGASGPPDAAPPDAAPPDAAPPDAAPAPVVEEPPDCGGDPLVSGGGDHALVVASLAILTLEGARDLDGDGTPDNKLAPIGTLSNSMLAEALADGTLVIPVEIYDHDADPDPCVKAAFEPAVTGADGVPVSRFRAGHTEVDASVRLALGRGFVQVPVPIGDDAVMVLPLSAWSLDGELTGTGATTALAAGRLDGVLQAFSLDRQRGLFIEEIGLLPEHSLADAFFANILGPILALESGGRGCRRPDIDVDGDGLETFCDTNPNDDDHTVDLCIDGDGTMIPDGDTDCSQALGPSGPRFVDGISAAFAITAEPP